MKQVLVTMLLAVAMLSCMGEETESDVVKQNFDFADKQLRFALDETVRIRAELGKTPDELPSPRSIRTDGSLHLVPARDWCSGFFPGELWYMYEYTQDEFWKEKAIEYTNLLEPLKSFKGTHDLGFMMYCSFGNGYRLNPTEEYKQIMIEGANSLISRFNPVVGCIRSWDFNWDVWQFPVIIDNLMNLDFLFWATKATGDSTYYKIAVAHANTTLKHHFRDDFSSFHVVDYDTISGDARIKQTHQGYADESAWARGQAWGLYGYTLCYRETGDKHYLEAAQKIADFILDHPNLPENRIPYWDYNAPDIPQAPRDVSASTVAASAFYELSKYVADGSKYKTAADLTLKNLTKFYRAGLKEQHGFLLHSSTGHYPGKSEISVPIVYADYYFLEALMRKMNY